MKCVQFLFLADSVQQGWSGVHRFARSRAAFTEAVSARSASALDSITKELHSRGHLIG